MKLFGPKRVRPALGGREIRGSSAGRPAGVGAGARRRGGIIDLSAIEREGELA